MKYHNPVMLNECLEGLNLKPNGIYVDVTFGGGGHSRAIVQSIGKDGRLFSFDQDADALDNVIEDPRFQLVYHNFKYLQHFMRFYDVIPVDGILADLGVSSHQFDTADRGFSIRFDADLDMRMDQNQALTAKTILNEYDQDDISRILWKYGEVKQSKRLAHEIIQARKINSIERVNDLLPLLKKYTRPGKEHRFHAQVFQALRIEVNNEIGVLKDMLKQAVEVLNVGGRLVVMSYHSLEDRLVKELIKESVIKNDSNPFENDIPRLKQIHRKPIIATDEEIAENGRSRSSKLRILEKMV